MVWIGGIFINFEFVVFFGKFRIIKILIFVYLIFIGFIMLIWMRGIFVSFFFIVFFRKVLFVNIRKFI